VSEPCSGSLRARKLISFSLYLLFSSRSGTAYLNLCFQQWTGTIAPISFEYEVDAESE
jgi:hypothetical protein